MLKSHTWQVVTMLDREATERVLHCRRFYWTELFWTEGQHADFPDTISFGLKMLFLCCEPWSLQSCLVDREWFTGQGLESWAPSEDSVGLVGKPSSGGWAVDVDAAPGSKQSSARTQQLPRISCYLDTSIGRPVGIQPRTPLLPHPPAPLQSCPSRLMAPLRPRPHELPHLLFFSLPYPSTQPLGK